MIARVVRILAAGHLRYLTARAGGNRQADAPEAAAKARRRWRWTWGAGGGAVVAVTLAATVPYLVTESQIRYAHAEGLVPGGLTSNSGLYRALPQLLNWLLLALVI